MSERPEDVEQLDLDAIAKALETADMMHWPGPVLSSRQVRALLTEVQRLREAWDQLNAVRRAELTQAVNRAESAVQEARKLRADLRKYGEHRAHCVIGLGPACDCGLDDLLAVSESGMRESNNG